MMRLPRTNIKSQQLCLLGAILASLSLAGCGGIKDGSNIESATFSQSAALALSGWYSCATANASSADQYQNPVAVLATPHGALYGSCNANNGITVNVSGNYSGAAGTVANTNNAFAITATVTNFLFYPLTPSYTGLPATNAAGTLLPSDSYASVPFSQSLNTGLGNTVNIQFTETGKASQGGAPNAFTVPTTLQLAGPTYQCKNCYSGAPSTAGGYQGSYSTAKWVVWSSALNAPLPRLVPEALSGTSSLTIDSNGTLTGTIPAGKLSGTVTAYDPATGTAEYAGTLTTSTGAISVQGAYIANDYQLTIVGQNAKGPFDTANIVTYIPLALFVQGSGFTYELLLQKSS